MNQSNRKSNEFSILLTQQTAYKYTYVCESNTILRIRVNNTAGGSNRNCKLCHFALQQVNRENDFSCIIITVATLNASISLWNNLHDRKFTPTHEVCIKGGPTTTTIFLFQICYFSHFIMINVRRAKQYFISFLFFFYCWLFAFWMRQQQKLLKIVCVHSQRNNVRHRKYVRL